MTPRDWMTLGDVELEMNEILRIWTSFSASFYRRGNPLVKNSYVQKRTIKQNRLMNYY